MGRGATQVLSSSLVSLERPGLRGPRVTEEAMVPRRMFLSPQVGLILSPGMCIGPRRVVEARAQTPTVLCALRAGPLHPVRVLVAGDSGIRVPYPFVSALCEVYALSTLVSSVTCKHWMLKLKHIN